MPKYYTGDKKLLFQKEQIDALVLSPATLSALFSQGNEWSICVSLPGLDPTCLGYVFHVRKVGEVFELHNICSEVELRVDGAGPLAAVMAHVCGVQFSSAVQCLFQQIRNDVGNAGTGPVFTL